MQISFIIIGLLAVIVFLVVARARRHSAEAAAVGAPEPVKPPDPWDVYMGLRSQMFKTTREKLGLTARRDPAIPWGVVVDWGLDDGLTTIVALADGNASVYLSAGGGYLGGQSNPAINQAAKAMVVLAEECLVYGQPTPAYPLPERGQVRFYLLTERGVLTAGGTEREMQSWHQPLTRLALAAKDVLRLYRAAQGK